MSLDVFLPILAAVLQLILTYIGVHVSLKEGRKRFAIAVGVIGLISVIVVGIMAWRSSEEQKKLQAKLDKIEANTSTPPNVTVQNVLPPSPPSRAKLHINRYEALSLEPDHVARLNVYFVNRGDAGAFDVFIVSRMRFIKPGKSVASLKEEEDAVFNEIQAEMKSSKNKIVSSTTAGSERWFTIDGPTLEKSDFQIPDGSKEREIARDGSLLIVAGTIKYRDKAIHRKTEFCGYMIKPGAILSCMGHNIED